MKGPDRVYGPQIANLMQAMCAAILKECGATAIRVEATFSYEKGHGDLQMKTFTTPDAKTERLLNPNNPMPRGSKLQHDVFEKLMAILNYLRGVR